MHHTARSCGSRNGVAARAAGPRIAPLALVAAALLGGIAPLPVAHAQDVEALQSELAQTRDELRTAQTLIETLREEIALLRAELRGLREPDADERLADLPAEPLACPASLAAELARRYARDLAHLPNASARDGFARAAEDWCDRMRREIHGRREWLVSVSDLAPMEASRDWTGRLRVYDEVSLLPLGDSEAVTVPARMAARLRGEPQATLWLLSAEVAADPMYNPRRATRGAFNEPTFVGPYVESGFTLEWVGLTPTELTPAEVAPSGGIEPVAPSALPDPPPPGRDR